MMHQQFFFFGNDVGVFLIKGININNTSGLVAVCIFVGCLSFLFEYLRYLQTKSKQKELKIRAKQLKQLCPTESASLLAQTISNPRNPFNITLFDRALLFGTQVSLWLLLQNLGYIIMLSVMLYDAWLLISAVIGGGIGYFVFGQKFMKINLQNCHIIRETYCTQICGESVTSYKYHAHSYEIYWWLHYDIITNAWMLVHSMENLHNRHHPWKAPHTLRKNFNKDAMVKDHHLRQ